MIISSPLSTFIHPYSSVYGDVISAPSLAFRNSADSDPILELSLSAYDVEDPYVSNLAPSHNDHDVSRTAALHLEIKDLGSGVDPLSVSIYVDAGSGWETAWTASHEGAGYTTSVSSVVNGYAYDVDRTSAFGHYAIVQVRVVASDRSGNWLDYTYSFRTMDESVPTVDSIFPTGAGVAKLEHILISLSDVGSGVDVASINVDVKGIDAMINGAIQAEFQGAGSAITSNGSGGFDVRLEPVSEYESAEVVHVHVTADDVVGNNVTASWSFTVEDYLGPLVDPDIQDGSTNVSVGTDIVVDISDESGIVSGSILIEVDGYGSGFSTAYEQGGTPEFKTGWDGPGSSVSVMSNGYRVTIDPVNDFGLATLVKVRVTASDPIGNQERLL